MLLPRLPVLSALLLLLLAAGRCTKAALRRSTGTLDGRSMLEQVGRYPRSRTEPVGLSGVRTPGHVGHHRDPRHKDTFIIHLTGPLYFNPKCRKHFLRLYHNTRDCTIPAYYRRCARLLTALANSPRCAER
ncbi:ALK and LTK ligand 2-like [Acanthopagrus latus]|uniref:ALK and LTK ligand 2-like n=1 Tax=Acanthopagrus latus TaxID=8177 RepID=UPI00187CDAE8|nr:ALK and LTK ligand 2-like [Acanthopagrus latus]